MFHNTLQQPSVTLSIALYKYTQPLESAQLDRLNPKPNVRKSSHNLPRVSSWCGLGVQPTSPFLLPQCLLSSLVFPPTGKPWERGCLSQFSGRTVQSSRQNRRYFLASQTRVAGKRGARLQNVKKITPVLQARSNPPLLFS